MVKVGVIGIGNMGKAHAKQLADGIIEGAILTAICDQNQEPLDAIKNNVGNVLTFLDEDAFLNESGIDAVLISTPHYDHPRLESPCLLPLWKVS